MLGYFAAGAAGGLIVLLAFACSAWMLPEDEVSELPEEDARV